MEIDDITEEQAKAIFKYFESKIGKKIEIWPLSTLISVVVGGQYFTVRNKFMMICHVFTVANLNIHKNQEDMHKAILKKFIDNIEPDECLSVRNVDRAKNIVIVLFRYGQPIEELLLEADLTA